MFPSTKEWNILTQDHSSYLKILHLYSYNLKAYFYQLVQAYLP